ncbi:MAG: hypothetical protein JEY96_19675 [Bacteroidales bacterium]|nr:hypothetical protein [Bacteroidales bacterium]
MWPIEEVNVNEVFLDVQNIRLPLTASNQKALLQDLFMNEDAYELVKSIEKYGFFPDELPIIIKENTKTIVIEGNRRVCCTQSNTYSGNNTNI